MRAFLLLLCISASALFASNTTASNLAGVLSGFASVSAGDTLTIAPGDYAIGNDVNIAHAGREGAYVVIRALQKGTTTLHPGGGDQMMLIDKKYLVFENITFDGLTNVSHCLHLKPGAGHLIVRNCLFKGTIDKAVKSSAPDSACAMPVDTSIWQDYQLYENCEAYANNSQAGGMLNINGPDYVTVRGNYIHDYNGDALYCVFVKAGGRYPLFENNLITNCIVGMSFGGGLTGAQWERRAGVEALDGICRNNVLVNMSDAGLHTNHAQDCKFINNTCINMWGIQNQSSTNITAKNNILMGGSFRGTFTQITNYVNSYNAAFFWEPATFNYRLKSTATGLVGAGTPDVDCQVDILGRIRPNPPSIGAYEVYGSATESPVEKGALPRGIGLAISPNPASSVAAIRVTLQEALPLMDLTITDARGRVVYGLSYDRAAAGEHSFVWNGRDHEGRETAPGAYFVRLCLGEKVMVKPFTLVR